MAKLEHIPPSSQRGEATQNVTGEQVRQAMAAANITYVEHHECCGCGYMTNYRVQDGRLYFDPGCHCTRGAGWRLTSFDEAADWINIQTNEDVRLQLRVKFGLLGVQTRAGDTT